MKRKILVALLVVITSICTFTSQAISADAEMIPAFSSESSVQDRVWVGTLQLVWNDFMDEVVKGPIKFVGFESQNADKLNKQEFKTSMLMESSYYTQWGKTTLFLKDKIEQDILEKFGETSNLLDSINWSDDNNAYLFYAMLKKDFQFFSKYEILGDETFNNSKQTYPYFGLTRKSPSYLYNGVDVLFYNNPFDYAVVLKSENDQVILYRTNSNKTFDKLFVDVQNKTEKYKGNKRFVAGDRLKVPYMSLNRLQEYPELCKKEIVGTDLLIDKALQSVELDMTRRGVKLKSEAVLDVNLMSMPINMSNKKGRNFYFNKTFVMFMKENNKNVPYFAARVKNMDLYKYKGDVD